jgi:hypothetical protein
MRADVSNGSEALRGGVATAQSLVSAIWDMLDLPVSSLDRLHIEGSEALPSAFPVTELAAATIGAASLAVSDLVGLFSAAPAVTVDQRLASLWFGWSIRPLGWEVPPAWDAIVGDYRAADGWIRLHSPTLGPRRLKTRLRRAVIHVARCVRRRKSGPHALSSSPEIVRPIHIGNKSARCDRRDGKGSEDRHGRDRGRQACTATP